MKKDPRNCEEFKAVEHSEDKPAWCTEQGTEKHPGNRAVNEHKGYGHRYWETIELASVASVTGAKKSIDTKP